METPQKPPAVYFQSLTIENVRCFKGEHTIDLSDGNGKPAMWTVILGNNNTGKTTLLRCLFALQPIDVSFTEHSEPDLFPCGFSNQVYHSLLQRNKEGAYKVGAYLLYHQDQGYSQSEELVFEQQTKGLTGYGTSVDYYEELDIISYGISRYRLNNQSTKPFQKKATTENDVFSGFQTVADAESWLLQTFLAEKNGSIVAKKRRALVEDILIEILPDVQGFEIITEETTLETYFIATTPFGKIRLRDLGYGYQSVTAWIVDLAKRMVERYPESENPLHEPAVVLVDELDLHLHPEWQRTIISFLSTHFPHIQFIVTTHSPLLVQSFEKVNLVVLHKNTEDDSVQIEQYRQQSFQGWTVEEILRDVMRMGERTYSDKYLEVQRAFVVALENDDYTEAKRLRDELKKMMKKDNPDIHLLDMQVSALNGVADD